MVGRRRDQMTDCPQSVEPIPPAQLCIRLTRLLRRERYDLGCGIDAAAHAKGGAHVHRTRLCVGREQHVPDGGVEPLVHDGVRRGDRCAPLCGWPFVQLGLAPLGAITVPVRTATVSALNVLVGPRSGRRFALSIYEPDRRGHWVRAAVATLAD
eukprot:6212036-Pleurochrysis_carterae.AAC.1